MLVLHYTGMKDGPSALARMRDPASKVSAHYMVEEDGTVFSLVAEDKRAWQAGTRAGGRAMKTSTRARSASRSSMADMSTACRRFRTLQIDVVIELCQGILSRWPIPQTRIVAHSDIAPDRKEDPGERFPWKRLADAGIGLWPRASRRSNPG